MCRSRSSSTTLHSIVYLPRLQGPSVLLGAAADGVKLLTWENDAFAYADSFDEDSGRYRGLRAGQVITLADPAAPGLLVKPAVARQQLDAETEPVTPQPPTGGQDGPGDTPVTPGGGPPIPPEPAEAALRRFHGSVSLDAARAGLDASRIADEVITHLSSLVGADVTVTLEIEANMPDGGAGQRCPHRDREQPDAQVQQSRLRAGVGQGLVEGGRSWSRQGTWRISGESQQTRWPSATSWVSTSRVVRSPSPQLGFVSAVKKGFCGSSDDRRPTQKQIEFASRYGYDIRELEREVADAVVDDLMTELNLQAVDSEGLAPGVQVFNVHDPKRAEVVSSIRADGTVYLKGGQGRKAWARNLRRMRSESS